MLARKATGLILLAALLLAPGPRAHADIITALSGNPVATGDGLYAYTYRVTLTGGQLDATTASKNGPSPLQFGTLYDFGPLARVDGVNGTGTVFLVATGLLNSSFAFSFNNSDAPTAGSAPTDDPTLANVRFTYTGAANIAVAGESTTFTGSYTTIAAGAGNLGTFTVYSPYGTVNVAGQYDGQSFKGTNNTVQSNIGFTSKPLVPPSATPEPASFVLLGLGLIGGGLIGRRRSARG